MCNFRFSLILPIALSLLSGCGTTGAPPITYAQNPFNPFPVKLKDRPVSPSTVVGAAGIALNAASPSVPGALSPGAGAGVASGLFLLKGLMNVRLHEQSAENQNALNMQMPISDATNETDAENKARTITDKATVAALPPDYQAKSESYDDIYKGKYWRREWFLVNGPLCENWSCQLIPMLQQSMFSLKDTVTKASGNQDFYSFGVLQAISLVKIINDFKINEKNKKVRVVEGIEIPGFDYYTYMKNVSKNMPEWLKIRFVQKKLGGDYMIESGIALPFIPNKH